MDGKCGPRQSSQGKPTNPPLTPTAPVPHPANNPPAPSSSANHSNPPRTASKKGNTFADACFAFYPN